MRRTILSLVAGAALVATSAAPALAEGLPVKFSERPLTLTEGTFEIDAQFLIQDLIFDTGFALHAGVRYGITDDLEVGAIAVPLALSPSFDYGNPSLWGTYRLLHGPVELGFHVGLSIPVVSGSKFGVTPGIVGLFGLTNTTSLWWGVLFPISFTDPVIVSLDIPLQFRLNLSENFFAHISTGLSVTDFDFDTAMIPLGLGVGYTIAEGHHPFVDIHVGVRFPMFLFPNSPGDTVSADLWQINLGASIFFGQGG